MSTTVLSARARAALDAICDTFVPGGDGLQSATELGVPEALLGIVGRNPRAAERKQVAQLLGLWDTRLLCAIAGGGVRRFTSLSQEDRERVLLSWADSRVVQRRAAFQALRKGTLLAYHGKGGSNGARNPAWDAIGYPGPLGPPQDPPPRTIEPGRPRRRHPRPRRDARRARADRGRQGERADRLGVRSDGAGMGHARPLRIRRVGLPDRLQGESDGHDRGARAHERAHWRPSSRRRPTS